MRQSIMIRLRTMFLFPSLVVSCWIRAVDGITTATGASGFQWKWAENMVSTEITQCENYGVSIVSLASNSSALGTPPYYMIAWKANGIPTVSYIGSDRSNLSWTVNQASGSSLILTVADSQGLAGGEAPSLYNVTDGDSSCLPAAPSTNITLVANISTSKSLETCDPLGLRVYGGQKPYTISLAAVSSQVITNITLNEDDDVLTWPDLADPNGQIMASVSDANGTWGTSTGIFNTAGAAVTNNTRCSVVTNSGNSANINQHPPQPSNSNHTGVIVGVVVAVVVVLLLAVAAFFLWRRRRLQKAREPEPAFLPEVWVGPVTGDGGLGLDANGLSYSPYDPPSRNSKLARYRDEVSSSSHGRSSSGQQLIGMTYLSPTAPGTPRPTIGTFEGHSGPTSGSHSHEGSFVGGKGGPRLPPGVSPEWTVEPDIIIQHRDGGAVQEIPPPYPTDIAQSDEPSIPLASSGPSNFAGLSVAEPSVGASSRPSSSGGPPTTDSTSITPGPILNKGKDRVTDLLS